MICDNCKKEYIRKNKNKSKYHFCSIQCRAESNKVGGLLYNEVIKTSLEKYGTTHYTKAQEVKNKAIQTNIEKYGFKSSAMNESVKNKQAETNIKKYGSKSSAMNAEVKEKAKLTCIEKYGSISPLQNKIIQEKAQETCRKNFQVPFPQQSQKIRNKTNNTILNKFGVNNISQAPIIKEKIANTNLKLYGDKAIVGKNSSVLPSIKETLLQKYGVTNPLQFGPIRDKIDFKAAAIKAHKTKKQNNSYGKSKAEDNLYSFLTQFFVTERQAIINTWAIDFYIKELDLYLQFDGVYWHGLDRNIDDIKNSNSPRDKIIYQKYFTDKKQNEWFAKNNIKLLRVTDIDSYQTILEKIYAAK